jgi:hypothetical protein
MNPRYFLAAQLGEVKIEHEVSLEVCCAAERRAGLRRRHERALRADENVSQYGHRPQTHLQAFQRSVTTFCN